MKTLLTLMLISCLAIISCSAPSASDADKVDYGNRQGDLGNGYYLNPILGGDYPDPTIFRDGNDYYMTHSSFDYLPGLVIFHSKDLVNWRPVSYALTKYLGSVWAPDIVKYKSKYYIYFTISHRPKFDNYVVWADSPYGPWSDPVDLKIGNIDPCHVVGEDGTLWMFLSSGNRIKLSEDGLSVVGKPEKIYDGWKYPSDWETACFCLEGPKLKYIDGYYYYLNAQGGTGGPPTAHMIVAARSKSIDGPWENSPYNPISRTWSADEHWWNKGHGSLIDTPDGKWYVVYHAYENGYVNLGRQTLMEPIEWTRDGWFKIPGNIKTDKPIKKPIVSESQPDRHKHLREFRIGLEWKFYKDYDTTRFSVTNNALTMNGKGCGPYDSSPLMFVGGNHAYEIEAEIEIEGDVTAGLILCYNNTFLAGTGFDKNARYSYRPNNDISKRGTHKKVKKMWLRLRNNKHVVSGAYSLDGVTWRKDNWGMEVSGYNHNTLYDYQSLLPGIFVSGEGKAVFKKVKYKAL